MGMSMPSVIAKPKRKQVKMACTNCAAACKRCDENRPCDRCQKYGIADTCVDGTRKERKKGVKRGPYKRKRKPEESGMDPGSAPPPISGYPPPGEGYYPVYYAPPPGYAPAPDGPEGSPPVVMPPYGYAYPPPAPPTVEPAHMQGQDKEPEQDKSKDKSEKRKKKKRRVEGEKDKGNEQGAKPPEAGGSLAVPPPVVAVG
ncbi:hypothetical protein OE88DRAFT_444506 [Heliocybe sulcata]|uniref:Transcription activator of gluconeogenesis ERT1 n=1 Tax=Heliocybe sulcata TaxID=5364 RepID=A0A5C3MV90_9AGAM|nr:hypothetical protein OE88DRAFT_444506 [Heliocybe sulcata]